MFKNLATDLDTDLRIILLGHQDNYVERSNTMNESINESIARM